MQFRGFAAPFRRPSWRSLSVAFALALAMLAMTQSRAEALLVRPSGLPAPVAAGTSAANIPLDTAQKRVVMRWVARKTATLAALHLRIQADGSACRTSLRTGYGLGNGGSWRVTTHPVLPDGRPDESRTLASYTMRPCEAVAPLVDVRQGITRIPFGLAVTRGAEYATVIRNTDPSPAANWTSPNFLYTHGTTTPAWGGLVGANSRNERSSLAPDSYYGLDPRELVGYSIDGGATWSLPGGPYGRPERRNFLPTYIQEFNDGSLMGQPYYYADHESTADRTMVFQHIRKTWIIRELGVYTQAAGAGTLTLTVDGVVRGRAQVTGPGMLRAPIAPVSVNPGQVVKVTSSGLLIYNVVADTAWGRLMGLHLSSKPWYVENETNFTHAAPIYALPAYDTPAANLATTSPTRSWKIQVPTNGLSGAKYRRAAKKRRGAKRRRGYGYRRSGHRRANRHGRAHRHTRRG